MSHRLRIELSNKDRRTSWLELFFDLVVVVVVSQLTNLLFKAHPQGITLPLALEFAGWFALVWWIWTGHTLYNNRFEQKDTPHLILSIGSMFFVTLMSGTLGRTDHVSMNNFATCYILAKLCLVGMYIRIYIDRPEYRYVTGWLISGFTFGLVPWAFSMLSPTAEAPGWWIMGFIIEAGAPLALRKELKALTVNKFHLPERFGLFVIILLGESVAGLQFGDMTGKISAIASAFILLCSIWHVYFEVTEKAFSRRSIESGQHITYGHLPLLLGLGFVGLGLRYFISSPHLRENALSLLGAGISLFMLSLVIISHRYAATVNRTDGATFVKDAPDSHLIVLLLTCVIGSIAYYAFGTVVIPALAGALLVWTERAFMPSMRTYDARAISSKMPRSSSLIQASLRSP